MKRLFKRAANIIAASSLALGIATSKANADGSDYMTHSAPGEALAFTKDGNEIVSPEHDSIDNSPDPSASYRRSTVIKYEVKVAQLVFYELKAQFVHFSPEGECLLTYHDIPSLQRTLGNKPSPKIAGEAHRAIEDLRRMASKYKDEPDSIAGGQWRPDVPKKEDCPMALNNDQNGTMNRNNRGASRGPLLALLT